MADYHLEDLVYELNYESAKIARQVADEFTDRPRFVAGSIGPTNRTASMSPDVNDPGYRAVTFDELKIAYNPNNKPSIQKLFSYFRTEVDFPYPVLAHGSFELTGNRNHLWYLLRT